MISKGQFLIHFADNTNPFLGNILLDDWNKIPNNPIKEIDYRLSNTIFKLKGFESYNHLIKKHLFLFKKQRSNIEWIKVVGKNNFEYHIINFNFPKNIVDVKIINEQDFEERDVSGWKEGSPATNPQIYKAVPKIS